MKTAARIRFEALSAEWFTETTFQPSDSRICMHSTFLDIVSMGKPPCRSSLNRCGSVRVF
jgi:hypothetical protein